MTAYLGRMSEKVISERFAALSASVTKEQVAIPALCFLEVHMAIKIYEVNADYIDYLSQFSPHLFHNASPGQQNTRKYIGILITVHGWNYFAPLSSFKSKHQKMSESLDFLKIKNYAVINLNNMFPVSDSLVSPVNFTQVKNTKYRQLLQAEYRVLKSRQELIRKNALSLYKIKTSSTSPTALTKRCNDFLLLEQKAFLYGGRKKNDCTDSRSQHI